MVEDRDDVLWGHGSNPFLTVEHKTSAKNLEASRKRMPHPRHSATKWEPLSTPKRVIIRVSHLEAVSNLTVAKNLSIGSHKSLPLAHSHSQATNENASAKRLCAAECHPSASRRTTTASIPESQEAQVELKLEWTVVGTSTVLHTVIPD